MRCAAQRLEYDDVCDDALLSCHVHHGAIVCRTMLHRIPARALGSIRKPSEVDPTLR